MPTHFALLIFIYYIFNIAYTNEIELSSDILKPSTNDSSRSKIVDINTLTTYKKIANNEETNLSVLFNINIMKNEEKNEKKIRQPLELAIVLDNSGSMFGEKLKYSKNAIKNILYTIGVNDIIHLITYSASAQVRFTGGGKNEIDALLQKVDEIESQDSTNMYAGLNEAYNLLVRERVNNNRPKNVRIFLFSDGLVNIGPGDKSIFNLVNEMTKSSILVSSFGVGDDYDHKLMVTISEIGKGQFLYIETPREIEKVVQIMTHSLESIVGLNGLLKFKEINNDNNDISVKFVNFYDKAATIEQGLSDGITIGDLMHGDSLAVLVTLKVHPKLLDLKNSINKRLFEWTFTFDDIFISNIQFHQTINNFVEIEIIGDNMEQDLKNWKNEIDSYVQVEQKLADLRQEDKKILKNIENNKLDQAENDMANNILLIDDIISSFDSDVPEALSIKTETIKKRSMRALDEIRKKDKKKARMVHEHNDKLNNYGSAYHRDL